MSLYLCVFRGEEEIGGVDCGSYGDFGEFRTAVATALEGGARGSRFPTLMLHSDCDGCWDVAAATRLEAELLEIGEAFSRLPPRPLVGWQAGATAKLGRQPNTLYESFVDADGEPLLARLFALCKLAQQSGEPILFQ